MKALYKEIIKHSPSLDFPYLVVPPYEDRIRFLIFCSESMKQGLLLCKERESFRKNYSFAIPSEEIIQQLASYIGNQKVLEIGAGLGLWAKLLRDKGVNIIATDNFSMEKLKASSVFTKVETIDCKKAMVKYDSCNVLMLIWPHYETTVASDSISLFKGNKIIYIGEPCGCSCADILFFKIIEKDWSLKQKINIKRWPGIVDDVYIYEKK